jgi:zinc/manganese transport system substrate-binding protein
MMAVTTFYRARMTGAVLLLALALAALTGCDTASPAASGAEPTSTGGKLAVVATTTQIRSMAEAVAGDLATVRSIIPPGADAHEFEPRPSDVQAISQSAVVLKNGVGLDDWVDKIIQNAGGQRPLVTVSKDAHLRKGDTEDPQGDPHIWFDVTNAMTMTRNIRDALVQADPAHADAYKANAETYLGKLSELDKYIFAQVGTIPPDQRKIVTNHDAFGYFVDRYGLTFVGSIIPSMTTEAQPSASDMAELAEKIKETHTKAIFLENSINPKLAEQLAHDAGVKVVDTLYGDSLGEPGTPAATYDGMMRYDTDTIVKALK